MKSRIQINKEPIILRIYLLLATFFIAVFLVWSVDIFFSYENERFKNELVNLQQKQQLGNLLQKRLYQISVQFINYPLISHPQQLINSNTKIEELIASAHEVILTLEKGGTIHETLEANFYETDEFVNEIIYHPESSSEFMMEVINIRPKLNDLRKLAETMTDLVSKKLNATDPVEISKLSVDVSFEIKMAETVLTRTHEHGNKIYFDVSNKLQQLETVYNSKLRHWKIYEAIVILIISLIELLIIIYLVSQTRQVIMKQRKADDENRQLLNAVENSPVAITITDADGKIEYVNKQFSQLTGFDKSEAIGQSTSIIKSDAQNPELFDELWNEVKHGNTWKGEIVNKKKDGTEYYSRSVISPIFDENNRTTNFISIQEDLTENRKLETSLNKSYDTLKEVFDKIPVGVVLLKGKTIVQINVAAAEIMGYDSHEEAMDFLNGKICHGRYCSVAEGECPIYDLKGGYFSLQEKNMVGKGGQSISILKSVIPVVIHGEEYLLEAFMDIEAQKKAQEREKEANRAKSEFLANMSHEIRTPMNGIIGAVDIMNNAHLEEEQQSLLSIIQRSSETLLNIINDILDFSKIEAGKLEIDKYSFNIYDSVEAIIDQFALRAKDKNLSLFHLIDKDLPRFVLADEGRLMQILINLVGNAIKFTEKGHVLLRAIKSECAEEGKVGVHFVIEDTGIGIPKNRIEKIFEAFTQADGSTIRRFGGTGLGTTISRMLVDLMGGEIYAESPNKNSIEKNEGPGSVFHVELTFDIDKTANEAFLGDDMDWGNLDVAVLSENPTTQCVSGEMLRNLDIAASFYHDPQKVLDFLHNHTQDTARKQMLILDFDNLDEAAQKFLEQIRKNDYSNHVKVVVATSQNISSKHRKSAEDSVDVFLIKPVKQSKLSKTISRLFSENEQTKPDPVVKVPSRSQLPDLKILLAEDNLINQKIAQQSFRNLGLEIEIAANGLLAVEAVKNNSYDFIFMDVMMPEMNGLDATREIRKFNQDVKIFAMTANAMKGDRESCLESGMNDYISKPFKVNDIGDLMDRWL